MWSGAYAELLPDTATKRGAVAQWLDCTTSNENATTFEMVKGLYRSNSPSYTIDRLAINNGR